MNRKAVIPWGLQGQALGKCCLTVASQEILGVFCTCLTLDESVLPLCKSKCENRTVTITGMCQYMWRSLGNLKIQVSWEWVICRKHSLWGEKAAQHRLLNSFFSPKCVKISAKNPSSCCNTLKRSWHDHWPSSADSDILAETIETHVFNF